MNKQVVIFALGSEEYGMPIDVVREITRFNSIRPVPHAPAHVLGLISIRGEAVPLIDLHIRFNLTDHPARSKGQPEDKRLALITEVQGKMVGFAVDEVKEVRVLDNIVPPPPLVTAPFISGLVNLPDRIIMQLIPDKILEGDELAAISELA